jgi:hypothetical protein
VIKGWVILGMLIGLIIASNAEAVQCFTQTYIINGQIMTCTTCGNVTNCF